MKENKMVETVFRFVTVRSPKKVLVPVPQVVPARLSDFQNNIMTAEEGLNARSTDASNRNNNLKNIASKFVDAENFISNLERLEKEIVNPEFLAFSNWLKVNKSTITKEDLQERLGEKVSKLDEKAQEILWDNLTYYTVFGQANSITQLIQELLRANHVISQGEGIDKMSAEAIKKLIQVEILLPKELFVSREESEPEVIEDDKPTIDIAQLNQEIAQYSTAIAELTTYMSRQHEIVRNTYVDYEPELILTRPDEENTKIEDIPVEVKGIDDLPPELPKTTIVDDFKVFSAQTQTVLGNINATTNLSLPFIIKELQTEKNKKTQLLYGGTKLNRSVLKYGGGVWVEDDSKQKTEVDNTLKSRALPTETPKLSNDYDGFYLDNSRLRIRPLGIADFRRVEQELCCYKPGEIAHIENILQGEYKERRTRRLRRSEDIITTSTESTKEQETDTTSTDRFELLKEASKVLQKDMSFDIGASISGGYGPISASLNSSFATSTSKTESDLQSVNFAKDITSRTVERIKEIVKEERISKIIEEFEENNSHGLDNRGNDSHIVGVYRWVDKVYKAQVVNYGKRLMFEFMLEEPGAYHLWAANKQEVSVRLENPIDPRSSEMVNTPLGKTFVGHTEIDELNYGILAAQYGADVTAPPTNITVQKSYFRDNSDWSKPHMSSKAYNDLEIPQGYNPIKAVVRNSLHTSSSLSDWLSLRVGTAGKLFNHDNKHGTHDLDLSDMPTELNVLPVTIFGPMQNYTLIINVECKASDRLMEQWKIDTYKAILDAYENKKAAYEQALAESEAQQGIVINGNNPLKNRMIEQQELKKYCISWLHGNENFGSAATMYRHSTLGPLRSYGSTAVELGEKAKFMEQAFEWNLMTYKFLPYFYARKSQWKMLYQLENADPQFLTFLQAGMARILVPVRPDFEKQIMHFLRTGQVWEGGEVPAINSPIYLSIVDEMQEPVGTVEGEPWEVRVPTSLTILQRNAGTIDEKSLPCDCTPDDAFGIHDGTKMSGSKVEG